MKIGFSLILLLAIHRDMMAQTPQVTMRLRNPVNISPSVFQYDVVLINTGTAPLALRGYSAGINHLAGMANGGTITHTFVSRGANLSTLPAVTAQYTAASNHLRLTTTNATAGNEVAFAVGDTLRLATMQVTNTVSFPADFAPTLSLQVVTAAGKTQCVATCIYNTVSYAINGVANAPATGTLQALLGSVVTPCFYLNPSGTFTASTTASSNVPCFNGANGSITVDLSSTGSTGSGTSGTYTVNGGASSAYSSLPISVSGLGAGTYTVQVTTSYGCVDTATATLTAPSSALSSSFSATACDTYSLPWSSTVTTSGVYSHTYITASSCDSIVTGNITINQSTSSLLSATACDTYLWTENSQTYNSTGNYTATSLNAAGCTHTATLNLQVNSSTSNLTTATACGSYTWSVNSTNYTNSGTYSVTSTNAAGCTHTETLTLNITPTTTNTTNLTVCDTYTWPVNTTTYTTSGNYSSVNGCNTDVLNLTVNYNTTSTSSATACNSYLWSVSSQSYTTSGTYTGTSTNASGCTDNATLNLVINQSTTSTTAVTVSGSYTWAANNVTYTAGGIYTATLINSVGCDSIATLDLTLSGASFTLSIVEDLPISCFGSSDAAAQATAIGTGTYTYSIDGGPFTNITGYFSGLSAGTHTICANDGAFTLCDVITFVSPAPLAISFVIDSTVSCLGNDGQISAIVTGGTANLQSYLTVWTNSNIPPDTLNNQLTNNFDLTVSNLPVGVYYLHIEDDHGCTLDGSTTLGLTPAVALTASNTPIACNGGTSVISASASGGTGNKTILVNNAAMATSYGAGTYTITATDEKGCTASSVLVITEPSALSSTSSATACNTYLWTANNASYTTSGTYTHTLVSSTSCDSVVTLNLVVNASSPHAPQVVTACGTYIWPVNGQSYASTGAYTATYTNANGCDSSYTLNLTVNSNTSSLTNITANNTYTWAVNGATYTTTGVYTATYFNSGGCVHTATLNLTINSVAFSNSVYLDQPISCFGNNDGSIQAIASGLGGPYTYILDGSAAVNTTGFFNNLGPGTHTVCALSGLSIACDTITLIEPAPLAASFTIDSFVSCHGNDGQLSINITGGTNILQGYLTWWVNAAGDTLNDILTDNFALFVDSLPVGTYTVYVEDDHGCFFNATGAMVAAPAITVTGNYSPILCFGGTTTITPSASGGVPYAPLTYLINNLPVNNPYPPGTYTITATDAKGCTGTTSITITQPTGPLATTVSETRCNFYTWPANGATYTTSGTYTAVLPSVNLCDSTVTLNLTIHYSSINAPTSATACNTYLWSVNGSSYTNSGTYVATYSNMYTCDSSYTLNLIINHSSNNAPLAISSCVPYTWSASGITYSTSGSYSASYTNTSGCDSTVYLNLTINQASVNTPQNVTACNTYTWSANSTTYTSSGTYTASFQNVAGCDSIRTLNLVINHSNNNPPTNLTVCNSYIWPVNGSTYTNSGTYLATYLNAFGCDSNYTLNITVNYSSVNTPTVATACNSYIWSVNSATYTNSGTYTASFNNMAGCDSSRTLNLTINNSSINNPVTASACNSYLWPVNGVTYTNSGSYSATFNNQFGCDSSYALNLTIHSPSVNTPVSATACNTYTWSANSVTYTTSGTYSAAFNNVNGCDSTVTLNLTINTSSVNNPVNATACNFYVWSLNSVTYTTSGTYTASFTNAFGCDSSINLNLTINNSSVNAPQTISACESYLWPVNGVNYFVSGNYTATYNNSFGCDSSYTLNLTVNPKPNVVANAAPPTVCSNSLVTLSGSGTATSFTWSGGVTDAVPFVATATTTYTVTGIDANGCSSTDQITVTVLPANGDIVNTTPGNTTSVAGTQCQLNNQPDGSTLGYHDASCRMIATIQDIAGGNTLGNTEACAVVYSAVPVYNGQPYFARYFTINAANNGPANVTLYLTQDDFDDYNANAGTFPQIPASQTAGTATLCISQVPQTTLPGAPGANTTVHSVTATWNAAAARWEINVPVALINGGYYLHACNPLNTPLPVTVTRFEGHKSQSSDILEWTTSSEINNAFFNLQYSTDGANFHTIAKVNTKAAGGNSVSSLNYSSENPNPVIGHNYYRLQQVDIDGHTSYVSQIVDLIWGQNGNTVSIYPNPASSTLNIDFYSEHILSTRIKLSDMSGAGMNNVKVDLSELAAGLYTVQIFNDEILEHVEKIRKTN